MILDYKKVVYALSIFLIMISPLENIFGIEIIIYPLGTVILILCIVLKGQIKFQENICLLIYIAYAILTCFWSKNIDAISSLFTTGMMFLFLYLQLQFDYTKSVYEKFEYAIIVQGSILLIICFLFGQYQDNRFWIISNTSGADPNYLSGWFILPTCICVKNIFKKHNKIIVKLLLIIEILLILFFVMQSGSRSGLICNVGAIVFCSIYELRIIIRKKPFVGFLGILVLCMLLGLVWQNLPDTMLYRLQTADDNLGGRGDIWKEIFIILSNNILGLLFGMGQGSITLYTSHHIVAHNTFLDILFETGIIGLTLYLVFCFTALRKAFSKGGAITIALLFNFVLIFTLSSIYMRPLILMFFMADCNIYEERKEIYE